MEHPLHRYAGQPPGAPGLGQAVAICVYCVFYLFCYAMLIIITVVTDIHLVRYNTLVVGAMLHCLGCAASTATSSTSNVEEGRGVSGFAVAMLLISLCEDGSRKIAVPFIADQQPKTKPRVVKLRTGEPIFTGHQVTLRYVYNLHYW